MRVQNQQLRMVCSAHAKLSEEKKGKEEELGRNSDSSDSIAHRSLDRLVLLHANLADMVDSLSVERAVVLSGGRLLHIDVPFTLLLRAGDSAARLGFLSSFFKFSIEQCRLSLPTFQISVVSHPLPLCPSPPSPSQPSAVEASLSLLAVDRPLQRLRPFSVAYSPSAIEASLYLLAVEPPSPFLKMPEMETLSDRNTISATSDSRTSDATPDNLAIDTFEELQDASAAESSHTYDQIDLELLC
ncbi:hypothetical protein ACLOJK_040754 [Asimina triloba]